MENIDWTQLSEVALIAVALIIVVRAFLIFVANSGERDKREDGLLKQMIDLAMSYKTESAEARDAYKSEAAATREVVQESNVALRQLTTATNEQTGEIRKMRTDFKNYQVLNADEIENFRLNLDSFKTEIIQHLMTLRSQAELSKDCAESAKGERAEINKKLDDLIQFCQLKHVEAAS